jgi:predicted deacylase
MIEGEAKRQRPEIYRKTVWVRSGDAIGIFLTPRKPGDRVAEGDVLAEITDPITEEQATIRAPRDGRIIGMAVPQLVLPGYGLFHIGYDPE